MVEQEVQTALNHNIEVVMETKVIVLDYLVMDMTAALAAVVTLKVHIMVAAGVVPAAVCGGASPSAAAQALPLASSSSSASIAKSRRS